jgi:phage gp36-like protein
MTQESTLRTFALKQLATLADSSNTDTNERIQASQALVYATASKSSHAWYKIPLTDLSWFLLKVAVASLPSVGLLFILYVFFLLFNQITAQVLGGF